MVGSDSPLVEVYQRIKPKYHLQQFHQQHVYRMALPNMGELVREQLGTNNPMLIVLTRYKDEAQEAKGRGRLIHQHQRCPSKGLPLAHLGTTKDKS